jgi:D-alanyl-D-alanine carboxypeptidase
VFAPGARFSYSNTGFLLAGLIIERVTGHSVRHELRTRILDPLHLHATTFSTKNWRIAGRHAHGYDLLNGDVQDFTELSPSWAWSAGNIVSDTDDVARFYRALLGGRLLKPAQLRAMQTTVETGSIFRYGLGLAAFTPACGGTVWGHDGELPGYQTWTLNSPDGAQQVVIFINGTNERTFERSLLAALDAFCAVPAMG